MPRWADDVMFEACAGTRPVPWSRRLRPRPARRRQCGQGCRGPSSVEVVPEAFGRHGDW